MKLHIYLKLCTILCEICNILAKLKKKKKKKTEFDQNVKIVGSYEKLVKLHILSNLFDISADLAKLYGKIVTYWSKIAKLTKVNEKSDGIAHLKVHENWENWLESILHIFFLLLTGEDEKQYWEKLKADRINKLSSKQKKKKKRGVDRVSVSR